MKQLRLFFAIDLPEYLKNSLLKQAQLDNENIWRWTSKSNLHLTLEFIGSVNEEDLAKIIKIGERSCRGIHSFEIKIKYLCFGPEEKTAKRMIWAVLETSESLKNLKNSLEQNLTEERIDFQIEKRKFQPHITLARLKQGEIGPDHKYQKEFAAQFEAKEFLLIQSDLSSFGPKYSVIQNFPL